MNPFHQRVYDQLRGVASGMTLELIASRLGEPKSPVRTALQALQGAGHVTLRGRKWFDADAAQVGEGTGADGEAAPPAEVPAVDGGAAASDGAAPSGEADAPGDRCVSPFDGFVYGAESRLVVGDDGGHGGDTCGGSDDIDAEQDETHDAVSHDEASDAPALNHEMFDDMSRELDMLASRLRRSRLTLSLWRSGMHMVDPCHIARLAIEDGERPDVHLRTVAHRLRATAGQLDLAADVAKVVWLAKEPAEPRADDLAAAAQAAGL